MMLRNKSPVTTAASVNSKCSTNNNAAAASATMNNVGVGDNKINCEFGKEQSTSLASPQRKFTHRRGYSHGSYSSLNASVNPNILLFNSSLNYGGTLGRPTNSSLEVQLNDNSKRNFSNHLSSSYLHHMIPYDQSNIIMKANSNDHLTNEEINHLSYPSSSNSSHNQLLNQSSSTPNEDIKRAISHIEQKIRKTKEAIKEEQKKCNENVNEYLRLSSNACSTQSIRIKSVFEKNNQKSTQRISRYQKKLKRYDQTIKDIKERGTYCRHTRERLRDVGTNIKEGISGLSGGVFEGIKSGIHTAGETVISKPKEFFKRAAGESSAEKNNSEQEHSNSGLTGVASDSEFHHGSDNSGLLNSNSHSHSHSTKCTSDDDSSSITSGSGHLGTNSHHNSAHLSNSPLRVKPIKKVYTVAELEQLRIKIDERGQDCLRLNDEIDVLKTQFQSEYSILSQALQDEKYRVERVEEQLNDLTELHQKEIENLKQTISDLEEKIQYQTEERHRDVQEMLESFQTRISRMEHQQHQHLQQLVNLDSLENSNARALVLKLINVLLTVLQVVLLLVATIANILAPFLHTRMRIFTSAIVIIIFTFVFQHWPDLSLWTRQKIYENCVYILSLVPFISINGG